MITFLRKFTLSVFLVFLSALQFPLSSETREEYRSLPDKGSIASLISIHDTFISTFWEKHHPILEKAYPTLQFIRPEELHITLMAIGPWEWDHLDTLKKYALVYPKEINSPLVIYFMGKNKEWLTLELEKVPQEWAKRVMHNKKHLVALSLTKAATFDHEFRPHISLVKATSSQSINLLSEVESYLREHFPKENVQLSENELKMRTVFWLASPERPSTYANYIPLDEWLEIYRPLYERASE